MPKYSYTAVLPDGGRASGVETADDRAAFELDLYGRGLREIRVTEKHGILQLEIRGARVKRADLMHMTRQMAAFVRAGLPILDAVHSIGAESDQQAIRRVMTDIEDGLRAGERFSDCLDRHPKVFPEFYRGIVRSAELTGQLDSMLARLAVYIERDLEARRRVKSATIYPAVIFVMSIVTVAVLAWWVLPKFKVFFNSLDATLPLPTRILMSITDFLSIWWWALGAGVTVVVAVIAGVTSTQRGRYARDRFLLAMPVVGTTIQYALAERFCRILASMLSAGVPLLDGLRVATDSLRNRVYVRSLDAVGQAVLEGEGIAAPLAETALLPTAAVQMLRVGEDTGTLDQQLETTAQYLETELDYKLKKLTALFEPTVIVVMGLLVGFVAVALVSAMYGVFHQVKV